MFRVAGCFLVALALFPPSSQQTDALPLEKIKLPAGFTIDIYASDVENARQMALGSQGTVFVGSRDPDRVYALVDKDGDHKADRVTTVAQNLFTPSGVAFRDGALYVAEVNRVIRFDAIESNLEKPPKPVVVNDTFPADRAHGWKFIGFGPDGFLYVPVGAPCNVCAPRDPRYASIMRMRSDGSGLEVFAHGVRNTVGFDWHPGSRALWFTDNGRDGMGDELPGDELNVAAQKGLHFGFPYCHEGRVPDPEFGKQRPCDEFVKPAGVLGPHVAAIGIRFYTGRMFPAEYRNQIFIAEHGSWNRSTPVGYRVMVAKVDGEKVVSYEPFAEGWLEGIGRRSGERTEGDAWGRPVDVLVMPDGALLISDDESGTVYRVSYRG